MYHDMAIYQYIIASLVWIVLDCKLDFSYCDNFFTNSVAQSDFIDGLFQSSEAMKNYNRPLTGNNKAA